MSTSVFAAAAIALARTAAHGRPALVWGLLYIVGLIDVVVIAVLIYAEIAGAYLRARWYPAQATVTGHKTTRVFVWNPLAYTPPVSRRDAIARYTGRDGREHTLEFLARDRPRPIGSTVPIMVSARNPRRACVPPRARRRSLLVAIAIAIAIGLLLALVSPAGVLAR